MRIFLSYSSKDKEIVEKFSERLQKQGLQVFFDAQSIPVGASIASSIEERISRADAVIFFVSKDALQSEWFNMELSIAVSNRYSGRQTRIIPVLLDTESKTPFFLSDFQCLDLTMSRSEAEIDAKASMLATSLSVDEPKGAPESRLIKRQREIEIESQLLLARKLQYEELKRHKARQLFLLTGVASMFSMAGLAIFLLHTFASVKFSEFGWLIYTLLGAIFTMIGSFMYMRKELPEKERLRKIISDIESHMSKLEGRDD
ncbi:toll/interleukin-1 receptor domain-containing protein [Rhodanobacter sp. Si-c]|uniref:Toll/interleukin-1 receptor domain-containing protein n=1 Tax=Rhodanobacter lycopersici TaxID=3162487 RepID=A0ABV3QFW5_9GAMM